MYRQNQTILSLHSSTSGFEIVAWLNCCVRMVVHDFILLLITAFVVTNGYIIDQQPNCSTVTNAINPPSPYVTYLGNFSSTQECIDECVNQHCDSYTYYELTKQCWSYVNNTMWLPNPVENANCGRIIYKCLNDYDCSLNGICNEVTGNCSCNAGWTGPKCGILSLLPANKSSGYLSPLSTHNMSSWGGAVQFDSKTDKYIMLVAEFQDHCGVSVFYRNCAISYAQTIGNIFNSEYFKKSTLIETFSCTPQLIYAPDANEYVLYHTMNATVNEVPPCKQCTDGSTSPQCNNQHLNGSYTEDTVFRSIPADNLSNGYDKNAWSEPQRLGVLGPGDDNWAAVINNDSSLIGMMRKWYDNGSWVHLVTATNWKDNTTYTLHNDSLLFPYLVHEQTEDMFLYKDCNGNYHALFHNMVPDDIMVLCGAHAYSKDGINWQYGGYAYNNTIKFDDNSQFTFNRRERPHLIFAEDRCTPIALLNAAQFGGGIGGDASYTSLQPIEQ